MSSPKDFGERYIARGLVAKTPYRLSHIKSGGEVYLRWIPEGGGWYQWDEDFASAYPFADASDCRREAQACKGPWYYAPAPETLEVVEVIYTPPQDASIVIKPHGKRSP